mmetsp:Transcript_19737/g.49102  ORF Transcript_19737/g.49102 Transcript_19737/m.49102 type:complete len:105 (+) Transcript_19737:270-584(+)
MRLFYNFPPRLPMLFFRDTIFSALLYFFTVPFSAMTPRDAHYAAITPPPAAVSPVLGESHFYTRVFYAARTGDAGIRGEWRRWRRRLRSCIGGLYSLLLAMCAR